MKWRRIVALTLVMLFLGMTVSSASATAELVNTTSNSTVELPSEFNPERKPGDEVQP